MALTSAQRRQVLRLGTPDSSFDKSDRYSRLGLIQTFSPNLTDAQRYQVLRLGIVDASVSTGDRYSRLGLIQALNVGGPSIELFETSFFVTPTWQVNALPQSVTGSIAAAIGSFFIDFLGTAVIHHGDAVTLVWCWDKYRRKG